MMTFQKLLNFLTAANQWLQKRKEHSDTKLGYAITKVGKQVQKALLPYNELQEEYKAEIKNIEVNNASTVHITPGDDKSAKVLAVDEAGRYRYTPEGIIKREKETRKTTKLFNEKLETLLDKECSFSSPYFATEIPGDLTEFEKEAFAGIVIEAVKVESNGEAQTEKSPI